MILAVRQFVVLQPTHHQKYWGLNTMALKQIYGVCKSILFTCDTLPYNGIVYYRGVNMFAMLTGTLPYSVNANAKNVVTLLHVKMLERKMNPIPNHLSEGK